MPALYNIMSPAYTLWAIKKEPTYFGW